MMLGRVVKGIAGNPAAPAEVLMRLLAEEASPVWNHLAWARLPDQVVEAIIGHPDPRLRESFAENHHMSGTCRARLVTDPEPAVRAAVAVGPRVFRAPVDPLPEWAQRALLHDSHEDVRVKAERHLPAAPALAELAGDGDPRRREAACRAWEHLDATARGRLRDDAEPSVRAAAAAQASIDDPDATDMYLSLSEDTPGRRSLVLSQAVLHEATARHWAEIGDRIARAAVAGNPRAPLEAVRGLAADPERLVRVLFASRPDLTEAARAEVDYGVLQSDRLTVLPWVLDSTDMVTLRRCGESAHTLIRRSVACHRHLPPDVVELLSGDDDLPVRIMLCENQPSVDGEVVLATYFEWTSPLRSFFVDHPNFPRNGLAERFSEDPDPVRRRAVSHDPGTSAEVLLRLSQDDDVMVRRSIAKHRNLPVGRLMELLFDEDGLTVEAAAANPALPPQAMDGLLDEAGIPSRS